MSISDADRAAGLDYVATVHHGIDLDGLPFSPNGDRGLVAFGRVHPDKGSHTAIGGSVGPRRRGEILGASTALLHPIAFDEPFGLSVVEAMVCGTPVVAYRRGSMPEVVDEGVTGFLVHTAEQAAAAIARIATIDRAGCRARARQRFGADRMVTDYLRVYREIVR